MAGIKRSQIVMLSLVGLPLGAIELANAFPPHELHRNLYADRAACERDYSSAQCESHSGSGGTGHGGGSGYHGPYYSATRSAVAAADPGPGRTGQVTRTEISTRGGFGAFGRVARAVG